MSTAAGPAYRPYHPRPTNEPRPQPHRRLRAAAPARRVPRLPFIVLTGLAVVAGVLGLVALNVSVSQQAFAIARLERANRQAELRYANLQAETARLKAPDRIAREAAKRHLVPAGRPRVAKWPGSGSGGTTSPGAATSPAAPGARSPDRADAWPPQDPFPLKQYLAEP